MAGASVLRIGSSRITANILGEGCHILVAKTLNR